MYRGKTKEQKRQIREKAAIFIALGIIVSFLAYGLIIGKTTFDVSNQVISILSVLILVGTLLFISAGEKGADFIFRVVFFGPFVIRTIRYLIKNFISR